MLHAFPRTKRECAALFSSIALFFIAPACAEDSLNGNPPAPPTCASNERLVEGVCILLTGGLEGRLCNENTGSWIGNATVTIEAEGQTFTAQTDADGHFEMPDVPVGVWTMDVEGASYSGEINGVRVVEGETRFVGADSCDAGRVVGHLCDPTTGMWVSGAQVSINDIAGSSTTTNAQGEYVFENLPPGDYLITVRVNGTQNSFSVTVRAGQTTSAGPTTCSSVGGAIDGRICSNEGVWLAQATVYIDLDSDGSGDISTTTDANGFFTLTGVPDGTYTVQVVRGSFSTSFQATVSNGQTTQLPQPVCIPPTTRIMVIAGEWDHVHPVLTSLGFVIKQTFNDSRTPTVQNAAGSIDVIDGVSSTFWWDQFIQDPVWMADYDIVFFGCGLWGTLGEGFGDPQVLSATNATTGLNNLQKFVNDGGSIYASDWASELVRVAFANRINFWGDDNTFGEARVGVANENQAAYVVDQGLASALNRTDLTLNMNLGQWVIVDSRNTQAADLRVLVAANVQRMDLSGFLPRVEAVQNVPLVVRFNHGSGRVLFTSAHNETQVTQDLRDVLNYIVFEL